MPYSSARLLGTVLCCWVLATAAVAADHDWPTFGHDGHRNAATDMSLNMPLRQKWVHHSDHAPTPAWPPPAKFDYWHNKENLHPRVTFDHAFHVAAVGERVYFGSSTEDSVVCLHAGTGVARWTFYTEGPVRLAPTYADNKLYFGSDDGNVYCLDPVSGELVWKQRVGPGPSRCIGNGRMISRWPVRSGILVDQGVAYCAAGIFPTSEGAFLVRLDAASGTPLATRKIDQSVQGYMALTRDQLILTSGRTAPLAYRRDNGKRIGEIASAGGTYTVASDDLLVAGRGDTDGQLSLVRPDTREQLLSFRGLHLISHGERLYVHSRTELAALNRSKFLPLAHRQATLRQQYEQAKKDKDARAKTEASRLKQELDALSEAMEACWIWKTPCDHVESLILAGTTLVAGGHHSVKAFDCSTGKETWSDGVEGRACGLAAAQGQLLVSTDKGAIYCFANSAVKDGAVKDGAIADIPSESGGRDAQKEAPNPTSTNPAASFTEEILAELPSDQGFCLIVGGTSGHLAATIAQASRMRVILVQQDATRAAAARALLKKLQLLGTRVVVHQGTGLPASYPPYFANLLLVLTSPQDSSSEDGSSEDGSSQDGSSEDGSSEDSASEDGSSEDGAVSDGATATETIVRRLLRPEGGVAWILSRGDAAAPGDYPTDEFSINRRLARQRDWPIVRRATLPGSGQWTHGFAEPGNSACSGDTLVRGPARIQWFGRPGPRLMADRHHRNVPPLYKAGRLFVPGQNVVLAVDAYNGTQLWKREIPKSLRLGAFLDCSNMVVDDRSLYVVAEKACHVLDVTSGTSRTTIELPVLQDGEPRSWGYLARVDQLLVGSGRKPDASYRHQSRQHDLALWYDNMSLVTSEYLFAMPHQGGAPTWTYRSGVIINPTITIGNGRVYFLESHAAKAKEHSLGRMPMSTFQDGECRIVALDLQSGKELWKRPIDLANFRHIVYLNFAQDKLVVSGNRYVNRKLWYFFEGLDARSGQQIWDASHNSGYNVGGDHGEQNRHPTIVGDTIYTYPRAYSLQTGKQLDGWDFDRMGHGCGNLSASAACLFWRGSNPWQWDLETNKKPRRVNGVTRPGCFINMIPAGGMLLIPEASSGCTCGFPLQTSLGYVPAHLVE